MTEKTIKTRKKTIVPNDEHHYLIIDTSYVIFYRFHALESWYGRAYPESVEIDYEIIDSKFDRLFTKCIDDLLKKYKINYSNLIFCKDASRKNLWRSQLYSEYKSTRKNNIEIDPYFVKTYRDIIPQFIAKGAKLLFKNNAEADDCACIVAEYIRDLQPENKITIMTNDNDYLQLIQPRINICNLQSKCLGTRIKENVQADLQLKIFMGDVSDNIPNIIGKGGKRLAKKYMADSDMLRKAFVNDPSFKEKYELNKTLICFDKIPNEIREYVIDIYKTQC